MSTQPLSASPVESLLGYSNRVLARHMHETWVTPHLRAVLAPTSFGFERSVVIACTAIHEAVTALSLDGKYTHDAVLTPGVDSLILGVRLLLDGQCGRLDCGTVSAWLDEVESVIKETS